MAVAMARTEQYLRPERRPLFPLDKTGGERIYYHSHLSCVSLDICTHLLLTMFGSLLDDGLIGRLDRVE